MLLVRIVADGGDVVLVVYPGLDAVNGLEGSARLRRAARAERETFNGDQRHASRIVEGDAEIYAADVLEVVVAVESPRITETFRRVVRPAGDVCGVVGCGERKRPRRQMVDADAGGRGLRNVVQVVERTCAEDEHRPVRCESGDGKGARKSRHAVPIDLHRAVLRRDKGNVRQALVGTSRIAPSIFSPVALFAATVTHPAALVMVSTRPGVTGS